MPATVRGKYIAFMEGFGQSGTLFRVRSGFSCCRILVGASSYRRRHVLTRGLPRSARPSDSPRWLADRGRFTKAEAIVQQIEGEVRRRVGGELPQPQSFSSEPHAHVNPLATIFSREYMRRTIMAFSVRFFALLGFWSELVNRRVAEVAWFFDDRFRRFRHALRLAAFRDFT